MKVIEGTIPFIDPPAWAVLERNLIALMNEAVDPVMDKYVRPDGTTMYPPRSDFKSIDGLDDAYESFHNWPLFYLVGGDDKLLRLSQQEYDAITLQYTNYDCGHGNPMVVNEYCQGYDWMHQGEGYLFFYMLCLADPKNPKNRARAEKYAGIFMNEDPHAINYDDQLKLFKSCHIGSMGPGHRHYENGVFEYHEMWELYGMPFIDIPGIATLADLKLAGNAEAMGKVIEQRFSKGDAVVSLAVTTMISNAYMFSGNEKYKTWVAEYVDAWIGRMHDNHGIIPDNVGLSGIIGEHNGGKWYGGNYGWTWPHGWMTVGDALIIAGENAMLLSGDRSYIDLPRSQLDLLMSKGKIKNGILYVPYKHGEPGCYNLSPQPYMGDALKDDKGHLLWEDGWFEFQPLESRYLTYIWYMSMDDTDLDRVKIIGYNDQMEQQAIRKPFYKDLGGNDSGWIAWLEGQNPDYPEHILSHNRQQIYERMAFIHQDQQDPSTYTDTYLMKRNPISLEGLIQLTMGGPLPVYNGGLLMIRVRYFDWKRKRPGLPADVAALVEKLTTEGADLKLVNLSCSERREVVVQGGAFGEHQFTKVHYQRWVIGEMVIDKHYYNFPPSERATGLYEECTVSVSDNAFVVTLEPGCFVTLRMDMRLFVNNPTYANPWEKSEQKFSKDV